MLYLFLLAHLAADFVLQPYWLVVRKRQWSGLLIHGAIVLTCMLALGLINPVVLTLWPAMLGITAVHVTADWWKVQRADRIFQTPIIPFLLDQLVHITTLIVALSLVLPPEQIWHASQTPGAQPALYLAAYLIAACAAPIAVMIWLDPRGAKISHAGHARLRSLLIGAVIVSLALFGGPLALPTTLVAFGLVTRRPASPHPLDCPTGILAILCVGSLMALTLHWMVH